METVEPRQPAVETIDPLQIYQEVERKIKTFRFGYSTDRQLVVWDPVGRAKEGEDEESDQDEESSQGEESNQGEKGGAENIDEFQKIHDALHAYHRSAAAFTTGVLRSDHPILNLGGKQPADGITPTFGTLANPNVDAMLSAAECAPFGRGSETLYDDSVRKAKCIPHFAFSLGDGFRDEEQVVMASLRREYRISGALWVTNRKIHIYEEGGHFAPHRDTLKSHKHMATVVIPLGAPFTGGELVIQGNACAIPEGLSWIAFFTDVLHEIRPVSSGIRIAIQLDVAISDSSELSFTSCVLPTNARENDPGDPTLSLQVVDLIQANQSDVIIPLYHYYSQHQLYAGELKPIDAQLYGHFQQAGMETYLVPLAVDEFWTPAEYCDQRDRWTLTATIFWHPERPGTITRVKNPTTLVLSKIVEGMRAFHDEQTTGNEAASEELAYWFAGIYVTFPDAGKENSAKAARR